MKRTTCKSGLNGWQGRLHEVYTDFDEFESYCMTHQIHVRLGYRSVKGCWRANPIVQGSVNPSDLCRVPKSRPVRMSEQQRRDEKHGLYCEHEDVAN